MTTPLGHIDEAERAERAEKQAEASKLARELALTHEYDRALQELEPHHQADPEPDPTDGIREAADVASLWKAIETAQAAHDPASAVGLRPVSKFAGELPPAVLWMDAKHGGGTVLRVGDVALLSGAGGSGKSFITLALAVAATRAAERREKQELRLTGETCGLHVRAGSAVVLSYEDDPRTVAHRAGLIAAESGPIPDPAPEHMFLVPDPEPLMEADPNNPGRATKAVQWSILWRAISSVSPSLVIVDPASAALAGVNQNDGATVRRFLRALAREAAKGKFGVLVVAHSTKDARFGHGDPGAGAVAGSGQWMDAARGVLFMRGDGPDRAVIECVKANHGPTGWAITLEADRRKRTGKPDLFGGWRRVERFKPETWQARREKLRESGRKAKKAVTSGSKQRSNNQDANGASSGQSGRSSLV